LPGGILPFTRSVKVSTGWVVQSAWDQGNRAVPPSNADKSIPGRMASHDVKILWKKEFLFRIPPQFFYVIGYVEEKL